MQVRSPSPNLDLLRSVAVLAVLADHITATFGITPPYRLGYWGVLLFFVHTSLVLMMSLDRLRLEGWPLFATFYLRRIFRIYPLSTVMIAIAFLAGIPQTSWSKAAILPTTASVIGNLLLCGNLTITKPVLAPLWSLPYEIQMYLFLPLLFTLLRKNPTPQRLVFLWLSAAAFGLIQAKLSSVRGLGFGRLDLAEFGPCFLAGVIAYFLTIQKTARIPAWVWPLILGASTAGYLTAMNLELTLPGFYLDRVGAWFACLAVALGTVYCGESMVAGLNKATHYIAKYSYGLYLGQVPVLWLVFVKLHAIPAGAQWFLFAILIVVVPVLCYHLIEEPFMKLGSRLSAQKEKTQELPKLSAKSAACS